MGGYAFASTLTMRGNYADAPLPGCVPCSGVGITRAGVGTADVIICFDHSSGTLNMNKMTWLPCEPDPAAHGQAWWTRR